jgi:hypothetical protein
MIRELALAYRLADTVEAGKAYADSRYALADPTFWLQDITTGAWVRKKDFGAKKP